MNERSASDSRTMAALPGLRTEGCGSPFAALVRLQLKVGLGIRTMAASLGLGDKRTRYATVLLILLAVSLIPWMAAMYRLGYAVAEASLLLNQPGLPVVMAVSSAHFFVFFLTVTHVVSTLFYSRDVETLRAMPFKPYQIVLAKMAVVYSVELLVSAVAAGPFIAALGVRAGDAVYWLFSVPVWFFVPALPVALALAGALLLTRFTRSFVRRDALRVALGLVFFAVIVTLQMLSTRVGIDIEEGGYHELLRLISERQGLIRVMTRYYLPARWASFALTGETLGQRVLNLVVLALVSGGAIVLTAVATESWFVMEERREVKADRAGWDEKAQKTIGTVRSPLKAIVLRDHRILARTPNFALTALLNLLVLPLLVLMFSFTTKPALENASISLETLYGGSLKDLLPLAVAGVHGLVVGLNQIASAGVSREGRTFWMSKVIPVAPAVQIRAKMVYSLGYGIVQAAIAVVMAVALLRLTWQASLVAAILCVFVVWPVSAIGLLVDLINPKLSWTEPQQAMKGNLGTLVAGLLSSGYIVGLGYVVKRLYDAGVTPSSLSGLVLVVFVVSGAGFHWWLERWATVRYGDLSA